PAATLCRLMRLARKRAVRSGATRLPFQGLPHGARSARRGSVRPFARRLFAATVWKRNAGASRLGQADRDRLLGALRAVFAGADVVHLFLDEFARRSARALTLPQIALCARHGALFRHEVSFRRVVS